MVWALTRSDISLCTQVACKEAFSHSGTKFVVLGASLLGLNAILLRATSLSRTSYVGCLIFEASRSSSELFFKRGCTHSTRASYGPKLSASTAGFFFFAHKQVLVNWTEQNTPNKKCITSLCPRPRPISSTRTKQTERILQQAFKRARWLSFYPC